MKENECKSILKWLKEKRNERFLFLSILLSVLLAGLNISIDIFQNSGNIEWSVSFLAILLLKSVLIGIPLGIVLTVIGCLICNYVPKCFREEKEKLSIKNYVVGILSFILIFLSFVPYWMAYFPGICSYDTDAQLIQIISDEYVEHHPLIHTLLFKACLELGESISGDINFGVAIYVFLQMIILSLAISVMVSSIYKFFNEKVGRKKLTVAVSLFAQLCMMLFPPNGFLAVTMTKDSIFSAFFLMMVTCFWVVFEDNRDSLKINSWDILLFISLCGLVVFRNNAKYALIITLFVLIICFLASKRRLFGRLFLIAFFSMLLGMGFMKIASLETSAVQGDRREMLSVPIQQIARCMVYHGGVGVIPEDDNTMSDEEKQLVNEFILNEAYKDYRSDISDPVKRNTNTYVVRYRTTDFVKTYISLFLDYPSEYVNAFLGLNSGFWAITDTSCTTINQYVTREGMGYIQTAEVPFLGDYGLYKDSKLPGLYSMMEKWTAENGFLNIPFIKYFFLPGIYFWIMVFSFVFLWWKRDYRFMIVLGFIGAYYLTMFFGPTVQLRYVFPIMLSTPFIIVREMFLQKEQIKRMDNA